MRRAGQKHIAPIPTTLTTPSAESSRTSGSPKRLAAKSPHTAARPATEIHLAPSGALVTDSAAGADLSAARSRQLAIAIRQRIESRLGGRIHDLGIRISGNTIILEGRCATYYSKQLAQHAALGILGDEHLENAIVVAVPR